MNEPYNKHYAEWKKSVAKGYYVLDDSIYGKGLEEAEL